MPCPAQDVEMPALQRQLFGIARGGKQHASLPEPALYTFFFQYAADMPDNAVKNRIACFFEIGRQAGKIVVFARHTAFEPAAVRSEERRVGKAGGRTCRSRWGAGT